MAKNKNAENNQEDLLQQQQENAQKNTMPPNQEGEEQEKGQDTSSQEKGENKDIVADVIFERYANIKRYYKTSDGTSFFKKTDAVNYAQKLEDKNIIEVNR